MTRTSVGVVAVVGLLLALIPAGNSASADPAPTPAVPDAPGDVVEDDVARGLVVKSSASGDALRRAVQTSADDLEVGVLPASDLTPEVAVVDFEEPVSAEAVEQVAATIAERRDVEWAIPNRRKRASAVSPSRPDDPLFGRQLQLWNSAARSAGGYSTKAPALWGTSVGTGVVVAVLDTGITDHPDLRNRLVSGYDMIGPDQDATGLLDPFYTANDGDGRDPDPSDPGDWIPRGDTRCYGERLPEQVDSSWHGTHVAGIVAAQRNNGLGISGVAPGARVQPVRVLGRCGGWDSDILAGITWASGGVVEGVPRNPTPAQVINLSLGEYYGSRSVKSTCAAYGDVMGAALKRGAVSVAAAGNETGNADASVPAACPNAISVAATSRAGRAAFYTNRGSSVDVSAYGGDPLVEDTAVISTFDKGRTRPSGAGYDEYAGTSMAAPAVAGAAALLRSAGVPATSIERVLKRSVQPHRGRDSTARVRHDGRSIDLNCTRATCGSGLLDLSKVPMAVSFAPKTPTRTYGSAATYPVSVKLDGRHAVGGQVQLRRGSTVLATATLSTSGTANLTVKGTAWKAGQNKLRVVYRGRWSSPTRTITIRKATPSVRLSAPSSVSRTTRPKVVVDVVVPGVKHPQGRLRVYAGKRHVATARLTAKGEGRRTITLPRLARGNHKIKVVYAGTSAVKGRTSTTRTVRSR